MDHFSARIDTFTSYHWLNMSANGLRRLDTLASGMLIPCVHFWAKPTVSFPVSCYCPGDCDATPGSRKHERPWTGCQFLMRAYSLLLVQGTKGLSRPLLVQNSSLPRLSHFSFFISRDTRTTYHTYSRKSSRARRLRMLCNFGLHQYHSPRSDPD